MKENSYIPHISKELLQWMPVAAFEGEVIIVDKPEMVGEAVAYLRTQKTIGVDTEARPSFQRGIHYPTALVCKLQIARSFGNRAISCTDHSTSALAKVFKAGTDYKAAL